MENTGINLWLRESCKVLVTSYSAELFSRLMSWGPGGLEDRWNATYGPSLRGILAPHMLLFADDALIFGRDPQELQGKLWDLQNSLAALGLSVNSDKCSILASPECPHPGVWALRSCMPLKTFDQFIFLGAPLGYGPGPLEVLGHSLRKASNSFFGFKRLLSAPAYPLKIKFTLLDTYSTSRWRWLAPAAFPTVRGIDSLEAMKNTFLLSVTRIRGDPFESWVRNTMARRRACRLLCQSLEGPSWAATWATQFWRYFRHVWCQTLDLPNVRLVRQTSQFALEANIVRPGIVEHILPRKFQKAFRSLSGFDAFESWEIAASDRRLWKNLEATWRAKWVQELNPAVASDYLMHMQLLVVGTNLCVLRPVRDLISETPYKSAFLHIQEATRLSAQSCVLLRFEPDQGTTVVVLKGSLDKNRILLIQQTPKNCHAA